TDGDLLTDLEETAVFATDINKNDTDGDGFSDGAEVLNLYNPAGAGKLADSGLTSIYQNSKYGYSVFYPKSFRLEDQLGGDNVFFFSGVDGSIQILAQDNTDKKNIKSWYAALVGSTADEVQAEVQIAKNGNEYIFSPDGLTIYLAPVGSNKVFVLTYSPEESGSIQFKAVLGMMINSFQLK
ncbi:MAG: thrombospondin type 3 repeat-containing protein, partial [Patescibacteria group bacterium]